MPTRHSLDDGETTQAATLNEGKEMLQTDRSYTTYHRGTNRDRTSMLIAWAMTVGSAASAAIMALH